VQVKIEEKTFQVSHFQDSVFYFKNKWKVMRRKPCFSCWVWRGNKLEVHHQ